MPAEGLRLPAVGLTVIRLLLGFLWFQQILWKLPPNFGCNERGLNYDRAIDPGLLDEANGLSGLCDWVVREANNTNNFPGFGWFPDFVRNFVIPNFGFFAWSTVFIETFLAVSLLLGLFTRLGGLVGTLFAINLFGGLTGLPKEEWPWIYGQLILLNAVFFVLGSRLQYSLDVLLDKQYQRWITKGGFWGFLGKFFTPNPKATPHEANPAGGNTVLE
jgi:uncharacterized membrane protein YphA (DoxX/SURF4 family)